MMKAFPLTRYHPHGSLIPVALVLTMLGGLFVAGFVAMSTMRAVSARAYTDAAMRRLALENSKAYAAQTARENGFTGNSSLTASQSRTLSTNWGGIDTANGWSALNVFALPVEGNLAASEVYYPGLATAPRNFPHNQVGLRPGPVFYAVKKMIHPSTLTGVDPFDAFLFMKSATPCLNGDAWVYYRKPEGEFSEIEAKDSTSNVLYYLQGRLVVRDPGSFFDGATANRGAKARLSIVAERGLYVQKYDTLNRCTAADTAGAELMPLNFPATLSTSGTFPSTGALTPAQLHRGELAVIGDVPAPPAVPATPYPYKNTLWGIQERESTATPAVPVQTINTDVAFGTTGDAVRMTVTPNNGSTPEYPPSGWPAGYASRVVTLIIKLDHPNLPNLRVFNKVDHVVFEGQTSAAAYRTAASMDPRIILLYSLYTPSTQRYISDVTFVRENARRIILGMKGDRNFKGRYTNMIWKGGTGASIGVGSKPEDLGDPVTSLTMDWRMLLVNEYRALRTYLPSGGGGPDKVMLTGGVMTNWTIQQSANVAATRFVIAPDWTAPYRFAKLAPREAWLENYFRIAQP
jgi:hypothetical protein